MPKFAWRSKVKGFPDAIVSASSRGRARYRTFLGANDAGYAIKFPEIQTKREPIYDGWAEQDESNACWLEQYLPKDDGGQDANE